MKPLVAGVLLLCVVSVRAQFTGLDDFAGAAKDTAKWGPNLAEGNGLLSVSGDGVVRYSLSGAANEDDFMAWPWVVGDVPFSQSWSVQADVHVPVIPLAPGFTAVGMGIAVLNSADLEDSFTAVLENLRSGPEPQTFHFLSSLDINGSTTETYAPTLATHAAVQITWDAGTQIMSAAYDTNGAVGGYSWTTFRAFHPVASTNWNLSGAETFKIYLLGSSEGTTVTLGHDVFADNFYVLDNSLPTLHVARDGGQVRLAWPRLAPGFSLESSETVGGGWSAVTNASAVSGEQNILNLELSGTMKFFRLRKP